MNNQFEIGLIVGLLIAYVVVRLIRSGTKSTKAIENPKYYIDDKTKGYILIMAALVVVLLLVAFHRDTPPSFNSKAMLEGR